MTLGRRRRVFLRAVIVSALATSAMGIWLTLAGAKGLWAVAPQVIVGLLAGVAAFQHEVIRFMARGAFGLVFLPMGQVPPGGVRAGELEMHPIRPETVERLREAVPDASVADAVEIVLHRLEASEQLP